MDEINPAHLRKVMGHFATGITVITWASPDEPIGMTANAFMSVSMNPALALISVRNESHFNYAMPKGGRFGVNFLSKDQQEISSHFGGKPQKSIEIDYLDHAGTPLINSSLAHVVCRVVDIHPAGDHLLYIGELEHLQLGEQENPLIFYRGSYQQLQPCQLEVR